MISARINTGNLTSLRKIWDQLFKPIFIGVIFPIVIIISFNLGLILKCPPIIKCEPIISIINYLSMKINYEMPPDYFIGALTIFILFFSFAQFSYSRQTLPANLIRKHILHHRYTLMFIGCQLSFSAIIGFFLFTHTKEIHTLNHIFIFIILITSVIISIIYFYWLSKNVTAEGMFKLISEKLNVEEINKIETANNDNLQIFEDSLKSPDLKIKFTVFDYFGFTTPEQIPISTDKSGIISSIDLIKIAQILSPYVKIIHEVILDIKVGQPIPVYETYSSIKPNTLLMRIYTRLATNQDIQNKIDEFKKASKDEEFVSRLVKCFIIADGSQIFQSNKENISELLQFYFYAVEMEPSESNKLIKQLSEFIISKIYALQANSQVKLTEKLFIEMIDTFHSKLLREDITTSKIEITLMFIYSMRNVAVKGKSYLMLSKLLSLLKLLFRKYLNSNLVASKRITSIILNIQEVSFSALVYDNKGTTKKELLQMYSEFLRPLIRDSLTQSALAFYSLIKYSIEDENRGFELLQINAQLFINLFSPLNRWQPLDELQFDNPACFNKEKNKIIRAHAQNIFHLSVLIFKYVEEKKLPLNYLSQISFPLVDNCHTIEKCSMKSEDLLDEFFFSYDVQEANNSFLQEEFELNKIHESGTYSPVIYDFKKYWIVYSLFRNMNGEQFIPTKLKQKTNLEFSMISNLKNGIHKASHKELSEYLNISENKVKKMLSKYEILLNELLKEKTNE